MMSPWDFSTSSTEKMTAEGAAEGLRLKQAMVEACEALRDATYRHGNYAAAAKEARICAGWLNNASVETDQGRDDQRLNCAVQMAREDFYRAEIGRLEGEIPALRVAALAATARWDFNHAQRAGTDLEDDLLEKLLELLKEKK